VSHHPPMSAYFYCNPVHGIYVSGDFRPKSKFLGNSAASIMNGENLIRLRSFPEEDYVITMPNVYARGILFGTMVMEMGDHCTVRCEHTDLICEVEFTTKVKQALKGTKCDPAWCRASFRALIMA